MIVHFDAQQHALSDYVFTLSKDVTGFLAVDPSKRICKLRYLRAGEPSMADERRFRMLPDDASLVVGNAKKRLAEAFIPQLTEHGWGPDGGKACGKVLEVLDEGGDVWFLVQLTEQAWQDAVDPGLAWMGRSAGFRGWMDPDGFIRPADVFEGSFTNFPAMKGLGAAETMESASVRFSTRNPSPPEASSRKEQEMKFSTDDLKRLGLPESATQEQAEARFKELTEPKAETPKPAEINLADLDARISTRIESALTTATERAVAATEAKFAEQQREQAIDAVLLAAETAHRITPAEREKFREDGRKIGPERLSEILGTKAGAEASRVFAPGVDSGAPGHATTVEEMCKEATEVFRYARKNGVSEEEARSALKVN